MSDEPEEDDFCEDCGLLKRLCVCSIPTGPAIVIKSDQPIFVEFDLKPCPFCGSGDCFTSPVGDGACARCTNCDTWIFANTETGAKDKWNTRPGKKAIETKKLTETERAKKLAHAKKKKKAWRDTARYWKSLCIDARIKDAGLFRARAEASEEKLKEQSAYAIQYREWWIAEQSRTLEALKRAEAAEAHQILTVSDEQMIQQLRFANERIARLIEAGDGLRNTISKAGERWILPSVWSSAIEQAFADWQQAKENKPAPPPADPMELPDV